MLMAPSDVEMLADAPDGLLMVSPFAPLPEVTLMLEAPEAVIAAPPARKESVGLLMYALLPPPIVTVVEPATFTDAPADCALRLTEPVGPALID